LRGFAEIRFDDRTDAACGWLRLRLRPLIAIKKQFSMEILRAGI